MANCRPETILPSLESFEDVFRALGVGEDAAWLREEGLSWYQVAKELGYGPDSMHFQLKGIAEEFLRAAVEKGLLTSDQVAERFDHFSLLAYVKT